MGEDDIIFEDMKPTINGTKWKFPSTKEKIVPNVIKGRYYSIYEELLDKCDPANFMAEYDHDRIVIANDIYTKTNAAYRFDDGTLKELRKRAMTELDITFSTEVIYEELTKMLDPSKYTGTEKFNDANDLYRQVINNADNIEELERIKDDAELKEFYPKPPIIILPQKVGKSDAESSIENLNLAFSVIIAFLILYALLTELLN